jgi:hypothetical protein
MRIFTEDGIAASFETITTLTSAKGFTSSKILPTTGNFAGKRAKFALVSVETADIRYTVDGTTPTVTAGTGAGHLVTSGTYLVIRGEHNINNFMCINAVNASGANIKVTYFF